MPNLTTSSAVDTMMQAANAAGIRSALGLGTASTSATGDFEAAGGIATHAALTSSVHGISAFGATLVDDASASAARTTLGLGTAATSTLATLLSDLGYTAATRTLASASTGASVVLPNADGTNSGLMASADYTKLNTVTTKRVVGRNTASTGATEEVTADQLLDWVTGTGAAGDMLYRGTSAYARLPASGGVDGSLMYLSAAATPVPNWSTKWTVNSSGTLTGATGSLTGSSTPALSISQTWNNVATTFKALTVNVTNTTSAQGSKLAEINFGANEYFSIRNETGLSGAADQPGIYLGLLNIRSFYGTVQINNGPLSANGVCIGPDSLKYLSIQSNYLQYVNTLGQSFLAIDGNDKWAFRNSTTAQWVGIYNKYTSSTNYERGVFDWQTTANLLRIVTEAGSAGGTIRGLTMGAGDAVGADVAGANTTIIGGRNTGSGTAGSIIFQTSGAGGTSTTNGTLTTRLQISGNTWTVPNSQILFDVSSVGMIIFNVNNGDGVGIGKTGYYPGIVCGNTAQIGFSSGVPTAGVDTAVYRDAAGVMALRNGTSTQTMRVYNTWSSSRTNYENLAISGTTGSNLSLTCESGGTGSANLDLALVPKGTGKVKFGTHSAIAAETVTGYITIVDAGGTTRKLAVVS